MKQYKNNRNVQNAWNMLQYLYDELRSKRFRAMNIDDIKTLDNLYALVITTWCASLAKEGLYKEYVTIEDEEMSSPRGQINVQESITRQTKSRGTLICSYDELSDDIYINHILKGTLQYFLYNDSIDQSVKNTIKKTMQLFNGVRYVDIQYVKWKDVKYNNSNIRYKHLLEICRTYLKEHELMKNYGYSDDERIYVLFKKQILKYLNITYGEEDKVELFEMPFTLKNEAKFETSIFKMQPMVAIKTETQALIIMIRLQDQQMIDDPKLSRIRLEEMVGYLREFKSDNKLKTAGTIMYVNTDSRKLNLQPITVNNVDGFMVGETTIDIYDQWKFITSKITDAYKYFIQREKNRNSPKDKYKS